MEWIGPIGGIVGILTGAYATWRTIRTERRLNLLGEKWRVVHFQNDAWMITNRMTSTARDVELEMPNHWTRPRIAGDLTEMRPGAFVKVTSTKAGQSNSEIMTISWRGRTRRRRSLLVALPPRQK